MAAEKLDFDVKFATFDGYKYESFKSKLGVQATPEINLIKGDIRYVFKGDREEASLFRWLRRMQGNVFNHTDCDTLRKRIKNTHTLVYFGEKDTSLAELFTKKALEHENRVLITMNEE